MSQYNDETSLREGPQAATAPCALAGKGHRKPVLFSESRIVNTKSGFAEKLLCDGPTFSGGTACVYTCVYCYVPAIVAAKPFVRDQLEKENQQFQGVVIRRTDAAARARNELRSCRSIIGKPLVIYGSPLVDVAATAELARETVEICKVILEETAWTVRLLSKSPLLLNVARAIPEQYKSRVIFGLSTGTPDETIARAIEPDAPGVSKRLEALRQLQAEGYRTYAMLCPVLPLGTNQQEHEAAAKAFAAKTGELINFDKCEHIWAEPMNERGGSFEAVETALTTAVQKALSKGDSAAATKLQTARASVAASKNKGAWEVYARALFLALAEALPVGKLRFLQYPNAATAAWWIAHKSMGAIPLLPGHGKPKVNPKRRQAALKA